MIVEQLLKAIRERRPSPPEQRHQFLALDYKLWLARERGKGVLVELRGDGHLGRIEISDQVESGTFRVLRPEEAGVFETGLIP